MKQRTKFLILAVLLIVLVAVAVPVYRRLAAEYGPEEQQGAGGGSAPDFTVEDAEGNEVRLSDFSGKPVVVNFWATWCGPCRSEMPAFEQLYQEYGDEIQFLMVNMTDGSRETVSGVQEFLEETGYSFPVFYDVSSEAAYAYSAYSIPQTVYITADGTIAGSHRGALQQETLERSLLQLLEQ